MRGVIKVEHVKGAAFLGKPHLAQDAVINTVADWKGRLLQTGKGQLGGSVVMGWPAGALEPLAMRREAWELGRPMNRAPAPW